MKPAEWERRSRATTRQGVKRIAGSTRLRSLAIKKEYRPYYQCITAISDPKLARIARLEVSILPSSRPREAWRRSSPSTPGGP
jgi:hypothetical protein